MDLRTRTSLFCALLAFAIAASLLLRRQHGKTQKLTALFATNLGLWYLVQWLYLFNGSALWARGASLLALPLPQVALGLFESLIPNRHKRSRLPLVALVLLLPALLLAIIEPNARWSRAIVYLYVSGFLFAGLYSLWHRSPLSPSQGFRRRLRFLVSAGALATIASVSDFIWFLGIPIPPIGAVLSILFLFVLSESLVRKRFVDIYDIAGQVLVSALLASVLASIYYLFAVFFGTLDTMFLTAFLATLVILILFEPLREKVNQAIHIAFFRERIDLESLLNRLRTDLAHVLQLEQLGSITIRTLESSRRVTGAVVYVRSTTRTTFERINYFGPEAPEQIETAQLGPVLQILSQADTQSIVFDQVELQGQEELGSPALKESSLVRILSTAEVFGAYRRGVLCALRGEGGRLDGLLLVIDDRAVDAFAVDEVALLEEIALQISTALENTTQHQNLQARDRLTTLGQMAAGLAHEIKNPLGAIKGAAQLLNSNEVMSASDSEFLSIIVEEVNRLDHVVDSVLDYSRPGSLSLSKVELTPYLKKIITMLDAEGSGVSLTLKPATASLIVHADAEMLKQALINLIRNGFQAAGHGGKVELSAQYLASSEDDPNGEDRIAIVVEDDGPGIDPSIRESLFFPFVTTKIRGTGLGLAITQRLIEDMNGTIEVASGGEQRVGARFTIQLISAIKIE